MILYCLTNQKLKSYNKLMITQNGVKYKKLVSMFLLVFCLLFLAIVGFGLFVFPKYNCVQFVKMDSGEVLKVGLIDNVTLNDNTAEKLNKKLKIVSPNKNYSLGNLVKTTSNKVMFEISVGGQTCYFSAIGKNLVKVNDVVYAATAGTVVINSKSDFETFRDNVNKGDSYSGSTVKLTSDIDLQSVAWDPIGSTCQYMGPYASVTIKKSPFSGTFDGNNHVIKNLKLSEILVSKVAILQGNTISGYRNLYKPLGLFGNVVDGNIKNLWLDGVTITSATSLPYPATEGVKDIGCLVGSLSGICAVSNIKLTNASISVTNTNDITSNGAGSIRFEYGNNTSAGGAIGCVYATLTSTNKNQTEVSVSYVEASSIITITGDGGCYTNAGGVVGETVDAIYVSSVAGGYRQFQSVSPKITIDNCLANSKMVVSDQTYRKSDQLYGANFGGILGRSANYISANYSEGYINISNCVSMINSASSITDNSSANTKSYSHPIFSCGASWSDAINQYLKNNYYLSTGFNFSSVVCATAKDLPT